MPSKLFQPLEQPTELSTSSQRRAVIGGVTRTSHRDDMVGSGRATLHNMTSTTDVLSPLAPGSAHVMAGPDGIAFNDPDAAAEQPSMWVDAFRAAIAHGRRSIG